MVAEFGATVWGRAWVRTIESTGATAPNPQLPSGRSLARNNAVRLTTSTGLVEADVTAAGRSQEVRIDLPPWSAGQQTTANRLIVKALADQRGLATGDLPESLEADLRHDGILVESADAVRSAECRCRTRRRPCAHILATVYALAQRIDERPVLAVELRSAGPGPASPPDPDWVLVTDLDASGFYGD